MSTPIADTAESMRKVRDPARAKQILGLLESRIADARFIGWRLLEQSLRDELARAQAVAAERGLPV